MNGTPHSLFFPRRKIIIAVFGAGIVLLAGLLICLVYIYRMNVNEDERVIAQVIKCTHDKGGLPADYLAKSRNYQDLLNYYKQAGSEEAGRKLFLASSACANTQLRHQNS